MLEYIIILIVVGWAAWFAVRQLRRESQGKGCTSCHCGGKQTMPRQFIQLDSSDGSDEK